MTINIIVGYLIVPRCVRTIKIHSLVAVIAKKLKGADQTITFMGLKCVVYYANYRSGH